MKTMERFSTLFATLLIFSISIHVGHVQNAVAAEADWMPDANLRAAVREDLGLANNEVLTQAKMLDLTSLHAPQEQISNLTGLEYATNLTSLVAWRNQITSLTPIQNLTNLTEIRIGNNDISDVTPLDDLTSLTKLGLQHNNISNVTPLAGLVNLTWLRLAGNSITDLSPLVTLVNVTNSDVDLPEPDTTVPGVSISVPSGTQTGAFDATITFTETVSGFVQSEVSLSGSAASITSWSANSDDTVYTATITPTASGTVTIGVAANVATDAANNQNTAATSKTVSVDVDAPTVTIGVPSGTQTGAFDATITFTETVSGFVQSEVSLSGSAASITSWSANSSNTVYTATITPMASGTVTIGVAANVATDAANNQNTAATSKNVTVSVDTTAPGVSISVPSGVQNGAFNVTITFTETVSDFVQSEVSLSGSAASITSWSANSANTVYTATITPTASGTVTIGVAANVATDAANNQNTAATSKTVTVSVDTTAPGVTVSVPSGTQMGAFDVTITFTETVSGFVQSEVSLSGSAASITSWNANTANTVYTATITPTASGTVAIGVAANVAADDAGNNNTAATSKTVTVNIPDPIPDPATWMPDANLRTAVRSALGIASDANFSKDDLSTLTTFRAVQAQITNLTSLEYATQLTSLVAWGNQISSLAPLTNLTKLTEIRIGDNQHIQNLTPLAGLTKLTRLGLQGNNISDVTPLRNLVNLTWLRLARNPITDFSPLSGLKASITDVDVTIPDPDTTRPSVSITVPSGTQTGAFDATITFSETVSGFVQSDVSLSGSAASITSWSANSDNTVYTATITPTASGTVTIGVAANVATDAANNQNTAATSQTVSVDVDAPTVTIGVPSGTQTGAFDATITFTETVSGFTQSDVSLSGGAASITSWSANNDDTVYTATITPTASGTVTIGVAANVATDAAGNNNTAATSKNVTVSVDTNAPGVSIAVPSGVQNGAFNVTITFTEAVSGFVGSDVSLTGSASSITSWSANSANTVYTATITPTTSGTVTLGVAANVATDAANNQNTAATSKTVTVDVDKPTVTIGVPSGTQTGAFDATITFSEAVSGFTQSDISLTGSAASITSWSGNSNNTVYTATITPTASGTVTIGVAANVATDAANNPNTAATSQTVTITLPETTPDPATWMPDANLRAAVRSALGIASNANFSKDDLSTLTSLRAVQAQVTNLTGLEYATGLTTLVAWGNQISSLTPIQNLTSLIEIRIGNNQISDVTPLDDLTSLTKLGIQHNNISDVTPLAGLVNLTWLRLAGNPISDLSPLVTLVKVTDSDVDLPEPDTTAPGVSISVPSGLQNGAFNVTITFTETVSDFVQSDVFLSGSAASITAWSANSDDTVYTATITPAASGTVTIGVAANVATDAANNQNTAATSKTVTVSVDTTAPGVTVSVPSGVQNGAFNATITFTETVSGFVQSEVSLSGSAASIMSWSANSDDTVYTATITPTASGTVTVGVAANVATDAANNQNTAATSKTVTVSVDTTAPGVSITVPSEAQRGAFAALITFTEAVSGFEQTDLSLAPNTAGATITTWVPGSDQTSYVAVITPTTSGEVTFNVAVGVATDAANNQNTAATSKTVTVDVDAPTVTIGVPSGTQTGAFDATITFTETVSGFVQSEVSLLSGSAASITAWSVNNDDTVYTATITPTASGPVTIGVAANVATDAANNQNTAATSKTVTVDVDKPTVTIGVPSGDQTNEFEVTITFTEAVSGFEQGDLSISGTANATITAWNTTDNITYTATITPTTTGTVTLSVAAGVATDAANNLNTASETHTVTALVTQQQNIDTDPPGVSITVPSSVQSSAFDVTVTFTEAVSGFEQAELSLTPNTAGAAIAGWVVSSDNTTYTATITPTTSGTVTLNVAASVATDVANNPNTAATAQTVTVDVDVPTVTIGVPSGIQTGAFDVTITFSETVSGFVQSEVSLSGSAASITAWSANSDDTVYTATITPTTSGTVTIGVAANVATDAADNQNTAATSQTVTVDVDVPTVTIGVPSGTQTGAFDVTITFSETVSGFVQSEVSLSGSAASITAWSANSDDTVYTATITPTASGTVTIGVAANVATDAADNQNTAATSQTVTVDVDAPTVTIGVPSGIQTGAFDATITFTETVSGFVQSEVSLSGSAASITSWSANSDDTVYTATITPTASGTVTIDVAANVATDAANNQNTAATSQTVQINTEPLTWMPDVNLSSQVLSALGLTDPNDLTQAGMATLTQLTATDANISDLTGLEHAINLTHLNLEGNSITNIVPIKGLDNLINLNLSHNQLGEVSSSNGLWIHHHHWPNLQKLDLSHNQIYCRGHSIFSDHDGGSPRIYADPLPSLTHLDVSYNGGLGDAIIALGIPLQTSPGIKHLQNLTHLDIRYTNINSMSTILYDYPTGSAVTGSHLEWLRVEGTTFFELYKLREIRERGIPLQPYLIDTIDIDVEVPEGPYHSEVPLYPLAPEQEKWMPDLPLRTAIREKLGLSDGEFLTQTKILELTELEVSGQDIYTTEGLEHATNLTSLDLSGTAQFTGDFSWEILKGIYRLPNLETLKLSDPQYTSSSFSPSTRNLAYTSQSCSLSWAIIANIMGYSTRCYPGNERIEHFPSLKHLEIKNWKYVDALWLLHLETLETLKISGAETYYRLESLNAHLTLETTDIDVDIPELTDDGVGPPVTDMSYMGGSDSNVASNNQLMVLEGGIQCGELILRASDGKPGGALDPDLMEVTSDGFTIEEAGFALWGTVIEVAFWIDNPPEDSTGGTIEFTIPAGVITDLSGNGNSQFAYTFNLNVRHFTNGIGENYRVISTYMAENANAAPQVSETLLPEETLLLANYPNPFNPETWIPYHLANDSNVQISIYDINGALVRRLDLGHQLAGYYTSRNRAAYWDGRNEFGEQIANGIYFYHLQADNMSLLRKMVILK